METLILLNKNSAIVHAKENKDVWTLTLPDNANRAAAEPEIKTFIDVLEHDNLIKANTFSVAVQDKQLYIDGEKQPAEVSSKYSKYINATGDFITKEPNR
jgi:hypothetical protein